MNTKKPLVIMRGVDLIEEQIERTKSEDWRERKQALKEICPCKVEKEIDMFWKRVFEMARSGDPSPQVRYQILHTLCDGSPSHLEDEVLDVIQSVFWNDEDEKTRRAARRVITSYRHTGKWNIMGAVPSSPNDRERSIIHEGDPEHMRWRLFCFFGTSNPQFAPKLRKSIY